MLRLLVWVQLSIIQRLLSEIPLLPPKKENLLQLNYMKKKIKLISSFSVSILFCTLIFVKLKSNLSFYINYQLLWLKTLSQRDVVAALLFWISIHCKWFTGRTNSLASCTVPLFDSDLVAMFFNGLSVGEPWHHILQHFADLQYIPRKQLENKSSENETNYIYFFFKFNQIYFAQHWGV